LKNSTADPCLFYHTHEDSFLDVAVYVDDGLVVGNKDEESEVSRAVARRNLKLQLIRLRTSSE